MNLSEDSLSATVDRSTVNVSLRAVIRDDCEVGKTLKFPTSERL